MKFRFKTQQYQSDAISNIVSVFAGQSYHDGLEYQLDRGYDKVAFQANNTMLSGIDYSSTLETGYGNSQIELDDAHLLENIREIQRHCNISKDTALNQEFGRCVLDIEMETGTGKTYVYIKTIFELNKVYGWSKFIIVVPSIAIREGVKKSLDITADHFMEQYHKKIKSFIYTSDNLNDINDFSQSHDIYVMIVNMQAFNSFKENANNQAARIIYSERDSFGSRRPIDVLANNNPIVILDEPQKMSGTATKESLKLFNPLFCLNFSATHKDKHNCVYKLDALDAYNQKLVKRIEVVGIDVKNLTGTNSYLYLENILIDAHLPPRAVITMEKRTKDKISRITATLSKGDDLYYRSGELVEYKGYIISDIDALLGKVEFANGTIIYVDEVLGDVSAEDIARLQIRQTIKSHLIKEQVLFKKGIKTLSLFFIDTVKHYRDYDAPNNAGMFQSMFEQEYESVKQELFSQGQLLEQDQSYIDYLNSIAPSTTHAGYFSIDKNKRLTDPTVKGRAKEAKYSDNPSDYELILKDKERLLSFSEPVRFIFSHSALREGWDNPNIFQICSLRQSNSTMAKRQEVGRGLRLCVDQEGNRQDYSVLGEQFHEYNLLTVIAPESYATFVEGLQNEINDALYERPTKIDDNFFVGKNIDIVRPLSTKEHPDNSTKDSQSDPNTMSLTESKHTLTKEEAQDIVFALKTQKDIDRTGKMSDELQELLVDDEGAHKFELKAPDQDYDYLKYYAQGVFKLLQKADNPKAKGKLIKEHNRNIFSQTKPTTKFSTEPFKSLWEMINHKYVYTVNLDSDKLIANAIRSINENLFVSTKLYQLTKSKQKTALSYEDYQNKDTFEQVKHESSFMSQTVSSGVRYDLLGKIAQETMLTRNTIAQILGKIQPYKFDYFKHNPEEFIHECIRLITDEKSLLIKDNISYHEIEGKFADEIFFTTNINRKPEDQHNKLTKSVVDQVFTDSDVEKALLKELESHEEILVYAKLPRSFYIPTPVGKYTPDWAICFAEGEVQYVNFIAETKGDSSKKGLRAIEDAKITCAKQLFNNMSSKTIRYDVIANYGDLETKAGVPLSKKDALSLEEQRNLINVLIHDQQQA